MTKGNTMEPVTLTTVTVLAALGVGFGAGWGLKPDAGVKLRRKQKPFKN